MPTQRRKSTLFSGQRDVLLYLNGLHIKVYFALFKVFQLAIKSFRFKHLDVATASGLAYGDHEVHKMQSSKIELDVLEIEISSYGSTLLRYKDAKGVTHTNFDNLSLEQVRQICTRAGR